MNETHSIVSFASQQFVNGKPVFNENFIEKNHNDIGEIQYSLIKGDQKPKTFSAKRKKTKRWKRTPRSKPITRKQVVSQIKKLRNSSFARRTKK